MRKGLMGLAAAAFMTAGSGFCASTSFATGTIQAAYFEGLHAGATPAAIALDAGGNILMAGSILQASQWFDMRQAFAAKLAPDGQTLLYLKLLGIASAATAIAVDPGGNAYVTGGTSSPEFPTTAGAWNTAYHATSAEGFVVKLDPSGKVVYSTLFGGSQSTNPWAIAVNAAGEAFVTGQTVGGDFPLIGGIQPTYPPNSYFLVRLSAAGDKALYSITGPGGAAVVLDAQNNAYTAGTAAGAYQVPITPNALQGDVETGACGGGAQLGIPCFHQYVCKVDATASKLYFCTFVSGKYGEGNPSIALDTSGNIYLAGTTQATDYPVTTDALQLQNRTQLPPYPLNPPGYPGMYFAFQPTGYFTKLSGDGARLLYSTYLGGSQPDRPIGIGLDPNGNPYIAALVQSPDYPGLPAAPQRCLPDRLHATPVLTLLDPAGAHSVVIEGAATTALMVLDPQNGAWIAGGGSQLTHVPAGAAVSQDAIACVTDAVDYTQAGPIVPGQLLTIFGDHLGADPVVTINGTAAPLLYASDNQINLQVPANVAGQSTAVLDLGGIERTYPVTDLNPSLLTNGINSYPNCNGQSLLSQTTYVQVLNPDGTVNSCANPAPVRSQVLVLLNAAGVQPPAITDQYGNVIADVTAAAGLPGVWLVKVQATSATNPMFSATPVFTGLSLLVNGTPVREQNVAVWLKG